MGQSIHFNKLWSCVGDGVDIHSIGGTYPLSGHVDTTDEAPLRPVSSWRTSEYEYVLAMGRDNWDMIQYSPDGPTIHATMSAHEGTFLGGWVDFKSQTLYAVELVEGERKLAVWSLGRSPQYRTSISLGSDVGSTGGQVVLAGRLDGNRHIAVLVGLTKVALVDVSTAVSPSLTYVIEDGGTAIAVRSKNLYIQAGDASDAWIASYDITDPDAPVTGPTCAITGLWGDGPDLISEYYGGDNLILSHDVRAGGEQEWLMVHEHQGSQITLLAEHRLPTPHGDIAVDTIDIDNGTAYFWGYAPQGPTGVPYYVAELDLDDLQTAPNIVHLP